MYSQNPVHINTVFLITLFSGFLPFLVGSKAVSARRLGLVVVFIFLVMPQVTALTLVIRIAQKIRQESRIAAQI